MSHNNPFQIHPVDMEPHWTDVGHLHFENERRPRERTPTAAQVPQLIVIEACVDGDLALLVGPNPHPWDQDTAQVKFVISSHALARAGKIFKGMFFGGMLEARPTDGREWTVALPEDSPSAWKKLLAIVHYDFAALERLDDKFWQLYDIVCLADKYDMMQLLRPWVSRWLAAATLHAVRPKGIIGWPSHPGALLWMAAQLGSLPIFRAALFRLVLVLAFDEGREFAFDIQPLKGLPVEMMPWPDPLVRMQTISSNQLLCTYQAHQHFLASLLLVQPLPLNAFPSPHSSISHFPPLARLVVILALTKEIRNRRLRRLSSQENHHSRPR
jgi:hypothetical protein